jgi:hypothetical protein
MEPRFAGRHADRAASFFEAVLRDNRPITDFIDGVPYLNERLARHYGIDGVEGPEFRRVDLQTSERSGVFTSSVLTVSSYPTRPLWCCAASSYSTTS